MTLQNRLLAILTQKPLRSYTLIELSQKTATEQVEVQTELDRLKQNYETLIETPKNIFYLIDCEPLKVKNIEKFLTPSNQQLAIKIISETGSTNQLLKSSTIPNSALPLLLITKRQTASRGRFGRSYFASNGGIYFSFALNAKEYRLSPTHYTLVGAIALTETIKKLTGKITKIKWVNDIYYQEKKIIGILAEANLEAKNQALASVVVGIGINWAIPNEYFPADIKETATSLFPDTFPIVSRNRFIATFTNLFFYYLTTPKTNYLDKYRQQSFVIGKEVTFNHKQQEVSGIAKGINDEGELIVSLTNGKRLLLSSGEISLINIK